MYGDLVHEAHAVIAGPTTLEDEAGRVRVGERSGVRPALATMRQRVLRAPKAPKMPAAVANTASSVRDAAVRAAEAVRIPVALAAIAATSQSVSASVQQTLTRTGKSPAFGVAM